MQASPEAILQLGFAFWGSKMLLSAVELGVFTALREGPLDRDSPAPRCGLHGRSAEDFLDALVALGLLEMINARLHGFGGSLTEVLRTGYALHDWNLDEKKQRIAKAPPAPSVAPG